MSIDLNEPGPSWPKRICTSRWYESKIVHMRFESESDENYDFSDFGSEYIAENFSQAADFSESSESDVDLVDDVGNVQNSSTQFNIDFSEIDSC